MGKPGAVTSGRAAGPGARRAQSAKTARRSKRRAQNQARKHWKQAIGRGELGPGALHGACAASIRRPGRRKEPVPGRRRAKPGRARLRPNGAAERLLSRHPARQAADSVQPCRGRGLPGWGSFCAGHRGAMRSSSLKSAGGHQMERRFCFAPCAVSSGTSKPPEKALGADCPAGGSFRTGRRGAMRSSSLKSAGGHQTGRRFCFASRAQASGNHSRRRAQAYAFAASSGASKPPKKALGAGCPAGAASALDAAGQCVPVP